MLRHLPDLVAAERGAKLVGRNRKVRSAAEPRLDLIAEAALLQLIHEALHVAEVRLRKHRRDERRRSRGLNLAKRAAEEAVKKSHGPRHHIGLLSEPQRQIVPRR